MLKKKYSTKPKCRKYVESYGFLSFARKFGDKYGKKIMDTATKTGIDAAKTAFKREVQKHSESFGDLIGNKIAGKTKSKEREDETNKRLRQDNAKDLDIVMPVYSLIEYSKNYSKTTGGLWNH